MWFHSSFGGGRKVSRRLVPELLADAASPQLEFFGSLFPRFALVLIL